MSWQRAAPAARPPRAAPNAGRAAELGVAAVAAVAVAVALAEAEIKSVVVGGVEVVGGSVWVL